MAGDNGANPYIKLIDPQPVVPARIGVPRQGVPVLAYVTGEVSQTLYIDNGQWRYRFSCEPFKGKVLAWQYYEPFESGD